MDVIGLVAGVFSAREVVELGGGHQSRVFRVVRGDGASVIAKVLDASSVDGADLETRLDVISELAGRDPGVCRPLPIDRERVVEIGRDGDPRHYVVCFEYAEGRMPDPAVAADARVMGTALGRLHRSLRQLRPVALPLVAALRTRADEGTRENGTHHLLHGDFNAGNLRVGRGTIRIFDFDDCGYGPPAFDVANALYMVLFDAFVAGAPAVYEAFRPSFVSGYFDGSDQSLPEGAVERCIDIRVDAVRTWLDDMSHAPIGIRTAPPTWHATLRSFVEGYGG